ncbi:MAG: hypothetical protein COU25_03560 [Candidatus Levybacteria bacterium CG10_big_fil_rev_8_21_14_0_10_35_13]|nr:MAG: hypothetical protein COU25_03560 [Candidatus Levybacteria bacterium CG10_big_fil_rev_8_21_14_0_10_35_13]
MNGFSTITQKGQVAIPKAIRDYFDLKPYDKVHFTVQNGKIVAQPVLNIKDMLGIISTNKIISKNKQKEIIRKHILKKYEYNS